MNRLWIRLTLAISLVVLLAVGVIAVLIGRTTNIAFRRYITHSGMQASGSGMQQLIAYYEQNGSWAGVDSLLSGGMYAGELLGTDAGQPVMDGQPAIAGQSTMDGRPPRFPGGALDALLADASGKVVFDSTGEADGRRLTPSEKQNALAITGSQNAAVIGYLLLSVPRPSPSDMPGGPERDFLDRMRTVLLLGGGLAVLAGLLVGALLSRSLTAPLRRLAAATQAVGRGHLGRQVQVEGSAEIAEVGRAFNDMSSALQQAEAQRQNMIADVAHELRTPLTVLQGNLRALLDDVYTLDKIEIGRLYDETRLLSRLVDDLRELALADAGQLRLSMQPTDLSPVIYDTIDALSLAAEAQEVTLDVRLPANLPRVQADPGRVAQVLRNLLLNALRHTPPGGSVTVTASCSEGMLQVDVADSGEGIGPDDLPHVFERFWRADPSRTRGGLADGSSGLGLSIAQSLIEAHGGRVWADSATGEGAVFRFTLPLACPAGERAGKE